MARTTGTYERSTVAGESVEAFIPRPLPPFVYAFVRKEAVLSAQIEGTQATLMDLLVVEASGEAPIDADVEEVCGYVDALDFAWDHLPLSMRLLSELEAAGIVPPLDERKKNRTVVAIDEDEVQRARLPMALH